MAEGNGVAGDGMSAPSPLQAPSDYTDFVIGGQTIRLNALTLFDLEVAGEAIQALTPGTWWSYARQVIRVIATLKPEYNEEDLVKSCSIPEARELTPRLVDFLTKSGFFTPGEAQAAMEPEKTGTGTSTPSSPILLSGESVAATGNEPVER